MTNSVYTKNRNEQNSTYMWTYFDVFMNKQNLNRSLFIPLYVHESVYMQLV